MCLLSSPAAVWLSPTERAHYVFLFTFSNPGGRGFCPRHPPYLLASVLEVWLCGFLSQFSVCYIYVHTFFFFFPKFLSNIVEPVLSVFVALDITPLYVIVFYLQGALSSSLKLSCSFLPFYYSNIIYIYLYTLYKLLVRF